MELQPPPPPQPGLREGRQPASFTEIGNRMWDEIAGILDGCIEGPIALFDQLVSAVTGMLLVKGSGPTPWALVDQAPLLRLRVMEALIVLSTTLRDQDPDLAGQAHSVYQSVSRSMLLEHQSALHQLDEARAECSRLNELIGRSAVPSRSELETVPTAGLRRSAEHLSQISAQIRHATALVDRRIAAECPRQRIPPTARGYGRDPYLGDPTYTA